MTGRLHNSEREYTQRDDARHAGGEHRERSLIPVSGRRSWLRVVRVVSHGH
jgi:hypothetical protein